MNLKHALASFPMVSCVYSNMVSCVYSNMVSCVYSNMCKLKNHGLEQYIWTTMLQSLLPVVHHQRFQETVVLSNFIGSWSGDLTAQYEAPIPRPMALVDHVKHTRWQRLHHYHGLVSLGTGDTVIHPVKQETRGPGKGTFLPGTEAS